MEVIEQEINTKRDKPSKYTLTCSECDFIGSIQNGLKVHKAKKHTAISENKSTMCEVCGESFKNGTELRKHSKSHSYKKANFKCEECDFIGVSEDSMLKHLDNETEIEQIKKENKELQEKLLEIEKEITILNEKQVEAMQVVEARIETSENNLKTVQHGLAEKDSYIVKLE